MDIYGEGKLKTAKTRQDLYNMLIHLQKIDDMPDHMIWKIIDRTWWLGFDAGKQIKEKGK